MLDGEGLLKSCVRFAKISLGLGVLFLVMTVASFVIFSEALFIGLFAVLMSLFFGLSLGSQMAMETLKPAVEKKGVT